MGRRVPEARERDSAVSEQDVANRALSRRRIRIESGLDEVRGWQVKITDADTGEEIGFVARAVITLDAREWNGVELTYYARDEQGKILTENRQPIMKTIVVGSPEVNVTAFESPIPRPRKEPEPIVFPQAREGEHGKNH